MKLLTDEQICKSVGCAIAHNITDDKCPYLTDKRRCTLYHCGLLANKTQFSADLESQKAERERMIEEIDTIADSLIAGQDIATCTGNDIKGQISYFLLPLIEWQSLKQRILEGI